MKIQLLLNALALLAIAVEANAQRYDFRSDEVCRLRS